MKLQLDPDLAQCAVVNADPEIFFMDDKDEPNYNKIKTEFARNICHQCPIREQCLEFAYKEEMEGVWGGTTTKERKVVMFRKRTGYVPTGRVKKKDMTVLLSINAARSLETSNRDKELLIKALETFDDLEPITIEIANLRIKNPGVALSELASQINVSKDVFAGRLRRLINRLDKVA